MGQSRSTDDDRRSWRAKYRPYIIAVTLAFVMTMLVAPEVNETDAMMPAIKAGSVLVTTKTSYSEKRGMPEREEIVILDKDAAKKLTDDNLIARVVGLPGDTIKINNGKIYLNGKEYGENNADDIEIGIKEIKVKKGHVFLLCDNRMINNDSRNSKLGQVDAEKIKGNVKLVIWPLSDIGGVQ